MPRVRIGEEGVCLLLTPDVDLVSRPPEVVVAELELPGLVASVRVVTNYATGFSDLVDFFGGLAADWRGWTGVRRWESIEGDLRIDALHKYGHVQLRVTLRRSRADWGNDGWSATGDLTIEPGEQLTQIAEDVKRLSDGA